MANQQLKEKLQYCPKEKIDETIQELRVAIKTGEINLTGDDYKLLNCRHMCGTSEELPNQLAFKAVLSLLEEFDIQPSNPYIIVKKTVHFPFELFKEIVDLGYKVGESTMEKMLWSRHSVKKLDYLWNKGIRFTRDIGSDWKEWAKLATYGQGHVLKWLQEHEIMPKGEDWRKIWREIIKLGDDLHQNMFMGDIRYCLNRDLLSIPLDMEDELIAFFEKSRHEYSGYHSEIGIPMFSDNDLCLWFPNKNDEIKRIKMDSLTKKLEARIDYLCDEKIQDIIDVIRDHSRFPYKTAEIKKAIIDKLIEQLTEDLNFLSYEKHQEISDVIMEHFDV